MRQQRKKSLVFLGFFNSLRFSRSFEFSVLWRFFLRCIGSFVFFLGSISFFFIIFFVGCFVGVLVPGSWEQKAIDFFSGAKSGA